VTTASAPASQNGGTRCVSGVPPARQKHLVRLRPTPGCLLLFCYRFAIHLLPQRPFALPVATLLLLLCYSFAIELPPLPFCAPSPRHVSDVYIAAPQGCPFRIPVIAECCPVTLNHSLRPGYTMPDGLANASRAHSKLRPRSPFSMGFSEPFDRFAGF